jgi:hypothetical protein
MRSFITDDAVAAEPTTTRRGPHVEVRGVGGGLYSLRLGGSLPAGWSGHLSLGLARIHIGIERGHARKTHGSWEAEFHLRPTPDGPDPAGVDYARMLGRRSSTLSTVPIELTDYRVKPLLGTIAIEVEGVDGVGFLGSLLARLAFLSLFPEEMNIETRDGHVFDSFRLKALAGRHPSPEAPRALETLLHELKRRTPVV